MPSLSIHLTDICNSRCSFCVVGSPLYTKDSIDFAEVVAFLAANANKGYSDVNVHGGEATVHPRFLEVLELIQSLGYPEVHLQTNAIRLADNEFAQAVRQRGVNLFIISLHGDVDEIQDAQTGSRGGFRRTLEGIRNVKALGARVRTNTVITRTNVERLRCITQLACDLGVDHVNYSNIHPVGSATFGFDRTVPEFATVREHLYPAIELAIANQRRVTLEGFPYCTVSEYISLHLNESPREIKMLMRGHVIDDYDVFMNATCRAIGSPCVDCSVNTRCGGIYPEYTERRGWEEFHAIHS